MLSLASLLVLALWTPVVHSEESPESGIIPKPSALKVDKARFWTYHSDPEVYKEFQAPSDPVPSSDKTYIGNLFAGRAEYNWIVDIRYETEDQDMWSVGNLIDHLHVLTTCRNFVSLTLKKGEIPPEISRFILDEHRGGIRISFCSIYLWVAFQHWVKGEITDKDIEHGHNVDLDAESGTRTVDDISLHPKCSRKNIIYDLAIIKMKNSIYPDPPIIGYMPIAFDWSRIYTPDLNAMLELVNTESYKVCYVASFGRPYENWRNNYAVDYKLRYRVYLEEWTICDNSSKYMEITSEAGNYTEQFPEEDKEHLLCMRSRAKLGTVCDHDRGAPVVCEGVVVGIVIRGAVLKQCKNVVQMPFVAVRPHIFKTYYMDTLRNVNPQLGNVYARSLLRSLSGTHDSEVNRPSSRCAHISLSIVFSIFIFLWNSIYLH